MISKPAKRILACLQCSILGIAAYAVFQAQPWDASAHADIRASQQVPGFDADRPLAAKQSVLKDARMARNLGKSADVGKTRDRDGAAEARLRWTLAIRAKTLGLRHPQVAESLLNLAELYHAQARYAEAEQLHARALEIYEKMPGPDRPLLAKNIVD
jgi:tetratricopeptide (TPR) repeat protein